MFVIVLEGPLNGRVTITGPIHLILTYLLVHALLLVTVIIPDSVTRIAHSTFRGCTSLLSVVIPDSLTHIGGYAFYGCTNLQIVVLPSDLKAIHMYAFRDCSNLKKINCPSNIRHIHIGAFSNCVHLKSIKLPPQLQTISPSAFLNCSNLKKVTIPAKVRSIGSHAFKGCRLEIVVFLGKPRGKLDRQAFGPGACITKVIVPFNARQYIQKRLSFLHAFTSRKMNPTDWETIGMPTTMKDMMITILLCLTRRPTVVPGLPYELVQMILFNLDTGYLLLTK
jgi:hypothetical protein